MEGLRGVNLQGFTSKNGGPVQLLTIRTRAVFDVPSRNAFLADTSGYQLFCLATKHQQAATKLWRLVCRWSYAAREALKDCLRYFQA